VVTIKFFLNFIVLIFIYIFDYYNYTKKIDTQNPKKTVTKGKIISCNFLFSIFIFFESSQID